MAAPVPAEYKGQTLPDGQIASWARGAGIPADQIAVAVAIALAESGGRIDAIGGPNLDGSYDYGLWQINERAHPEKFQRWKSWWSVENAQMMAAVYNERGWQPWTTYKSGAYLLYMLRGRTAAAFPSGEPTVEQGKTNTVVDVPDALNEIGNAIKSVAGGLFKGGAWLADTANIVRVIQVAVGGALVVGALVMVARPVVQPLASGAIGIATKGKI
jgi:hypothetical protein